MNIWRFDRNRSLFSVTIEFLGEGKKLYYFHPIEPQIYIFTSNYSYNPYHWKLSKVYFCNYDTESLSFSDRIHSYIYLNNYYTPLKIKEDGTIDCIKYDDFENNFCNFRIDNDQIIEIQIKKVIENNGIKDSLIIWDFLRISNDIYFYIYQKKDTRIYKQTENECKLIYSSNISISQIFHKNGMLIFVENKILKMIDINNKLLINEFYLENYPVNFCII